MTDKHTKFHTRFDNPEDPHQNRVDFDFGFPTSSNTLLDINLSDKPGVYRIKNTGLHSFYVKFQKSGSLLELQPHIPPIDLELNWKLIIYPYSFNNIKGWYKYLGEV